MQIYIEHIVQYLKDQEHEYKLMTLQREIISGDYENINNDLYNAVNYGKTVSEISINLTGRITLLLRNWKSVLKRDWWL